MDENGGGRQTLGDKSGGGWVVEYTRYKGCRKIIGSGKGCLEVGGETAFV